MINKGNGIVVNFSSMTAIVPSPFFAVYSSTKVNTMKMVRFSKVLASKAFDDKFTESIKSIGYSTHLTGYLPHAVQQVLLQLVFEYFPFLRNRCQ